MRDPADPPPAPPPVQVSVRPAPSTASGDMFAPIPGLSSVTDDALLNVKSALTLTGAAIIIAGLYFGREVLVPLALSMLLSFVLAPLVNRLKRWHVPRPLAVMLVVTLTLSLVIASGVFVGSQIRELGKEIPTYQVTISDKLKALRKTLQQPGMFDQLRGVFGTVERELEAAQRDLQRPAPVPTPSGRAAANANANVPGQVQLVPPAPSPIERVGQWLDSVSTPAATMGIVLVLVVLILLDRGDLRDRALSLLGGNLHRNTDALSEVGHRVSRYLTMQLIINALYGLPMAIGLWVLGVPGALLWGLVASVMRFVPYVGPMIAAVFPLLLAFAVDPGWSMVLWTLVLIGTLELVSNNIIEPWLYGASTGMSALSLIVTAMFWTALWGPVGLVLSTPLTVSLLVLGRYLPQLRFLDVMLSSQPPLNAPTRLYQRLLAADIEDATDLAVNEAERTSLQAFYNDVGVPALRLASTAHATVATVEHRHRVTLGMKQVVAHLRQEFAVEGEHDPVVVCLGGRWEVDAIAADMGAHALSLSGQHVQAMGDGAISSAYVASLKLTNVRVLCLSYFSPEPIAHLKHISRQLRQRWPQLHVVAAVWNAPASLLESPAHAGPHVDALVTSIDELVSHVDRLLSSDDADAIDTHVPAPVPANDAERLAALQRSNILSPEHRAGFDALAKHAADVFDCPLAFVSIVDEASQIFHGDSRAQGQKGLDASQRLTARALSMCGHVVAEAATIVVPDVLRDPRFAGNPVLKAQGIRFYAGAPLRDDDGHVLGTLCLLDVQPRTLSAREVLLLESMAKEVMAVTTVVKENRPDVPQAA